MSIGNNTFWVIVSIPEGDALTPPDDKRAALRFISRDAAQMYLEKMPDYDPAFEIVVRVRG